MIFVVKHDPREFMQESCKVSIKCFKGEKCIDGDIFLNEVYILRCV